MKTIPMIALVLLTLNKIRAQKTLKHEKIAHHTIYNTEWSHSIVQNTWRRAEQVCITIANNNEEIWNAQSHMLMSYTYNTENKGARLIKPPFTPGILFAPKISTFKYIYEE